MKKLVSKKQGKLNQCGYTKEESIKKLFKDEGIIMDNTRHEIWCKKSTMLDCNIDKINKSLSDIGEHYKELIRMYPGMTTIELIDQGKDYVTIKTNEGTMKRTNISVETTRDEILVEFDEKYTTSKVTSHSHFSEKFQSKNNKTLLNIEISNLVAPGFLGFFLRKFGSNNIGNGFLDAYKKTLENNELQ